MPRPAPILNQVIAWRLQIAQAIAAGLGDQWTVEACAERCRREIEAALGRMG